jgi:hypothetical protein
MLRRGVARRTIGLADALVAPTAAELRLRRHRRPPLAPRALLVDFA